MADIITFSEINRTDKKTSTIAVRISGIHTKNEVDCLADNTTGAASIGTLDTVAGTDHIHPAQTTVTGNAATAIKFQTTRTINGMNFDGSANITVTSAANGDAVTTATGNAGTDIKLQIARSIAISEGVIETATNCDGSANLSIPITAINPAHLSASVPAAKGRTDATTALGASAKSSTVTATLSAASRTGSTAPFTYSLAISDVTTKSNQELLRSFTITKKQLDALQAANIRDGRQSANTIIFTAWRISLPLISQSESLKGVMRNE